MCDYFSLLSYFRSEIFFILYIWPDNFFSALRESATPASNGICRKCLGEEPSPNICFFFSFLFWLLSPQPHLVWRLSSVGGNLGIGAVQSFVLLAKEFSAVLMRSVEFPLQRLQHVNSFVPSVRSPISALTVFVHFQKAFKTFTSVRQSHCF